MYFLGKYKLYDFKKSINGFGECACYIWLDLVE